MEDVKLLFGEDLTTEKMMRLWEAAIFAYYADDDEFENYCKQEMAVKEFDAVVDRLYNLNCHHLLRSFLDTHEIPEESSLNDEI